MRIKKQYQYLDVYAKRFKKRDGASEKDGYLPKLVVYFRKALDKMGIDDYYVPIIFGWDDDTAEDFYTWGHNSRWNHTFSYMALRDLTRYVTILKILMQNAKINDFEVKYDE